MRCNRLCYYPEEEPDVIFRSIWVRKLFSKIIEEQSPDGANSQLESLRNALEDCSVYAAPHRSAVPAVPAVKDDGLPAAPPPRAVEPGMKNADVVVPVPAAPKQAKQEEKKQEPEAGSAPEEGAQHE